MQFHLCFALGKFLSRWIFSSEVSSNIFLGLSHCNVYFCQEQETRHSSNPLVLDTFIATQPKKASANLNLESLFQSNYFLLIVKKRVFSEKCILNLSYLKVKAEEESWWLMTSIKIEWQYLNPSSYILKQSFHYSQMNFINDSILNLPVMFALLKNIF